MSDGRGPDGVLNVLKPPGMTSHDVVAQIRRRLPRRTKVGHAGTLDPAAAGVLVVMAGRATRLSDWLMNRPKHYRAEITFGIETDSADAEGAVTARQPAQVTQDETAAALPGFTGLITQTPPATSAVKVEGVPLHRRVRRGEEVTVPSRQVRIDEIVIRQWCPDARHPSCLLDIRCGRGTYIRSLARDLGRALGTVACLTFLLRLSVGSMKVDEAVTLENLVPDAGSGPDWWTPRLIPPAQAVNFLPGLVLPQQDVRAVVHGRSITSAYDSAGRFENGWVLEPFAAGAPEADAAVGRLETLRLLDSRGALVAIARPEHRADGLRRSLAVKPLRVLADAQEFDS
ncbi:MAG: tRNA pseudouridine(55) synthase TruB [Thermaerobacterales bacterium]